MTDLEPQKTRITHSLVHGQGRNPRFCGVCNLFLFVFFLNWIPFFFYLFHFRSHSVYLCFSLQESGFSLCRDACSDCLQRLITSRSFHQGVPFSCPTSNTYQVQLATEPIGSLFGKLEDGLFYSRPSIAKHFLLCLDQWFGLEWHSKSLLLFLACTEGGLIEIGILNNAVTLRYKFLVIVQQRAWGTPRGRVQKPA